MDINEIILKITTEAMETEGEFIFTTIKPWCEEKMQRKISKRDLVNALKMYFMQTHKDDIQSVLFDTDGTLISIVYRMALNDMFDELVQNSISVNNGFFVDLETIKKIYSELSLKNKGENNG